MIKELTLTNLLSFGETPTKVNLNAGLNVLIGANGSGKSNLIDIISLLQASPKDLTKPFINGGGVIEWLWKGHTSIPDAILQVVVDNSQGKNPLKHTLSFSASTLNQLELKDELIELDFNAQPIYSKCQNKDADKRQSIIANLKTPEHYPEISYLGEIYDQIRIYRNWRFGRSYIPRGLSPYASPRPLDEDFSNLSIVLNRLRRDPNVQQCLLKLLKELYGEVENLRLNVDGNIYITAQAFIQESGLDTPIHDIRLSDGTKQFLRLLAILLDPNPSKLICIENPEIGLHPDALPILVELLKEAGTRTQLIITTHSTDLIDELSDMPEAVLVCEKVNSSTQIKRLDKNRLSVLLKNYSLGKLWRRGDIGGNRW